MKYPALLPALFICVSGFAQPKVAGRTAPLCASQADMKGVFILITLLALFTLMNKFSRVHK